MKLRVLTIFAFLLFSHSSFTQEKIDIENNYLEYFKLPRESLFLHTNKTTYLTGETIWFKAYAYDRKNELTSKRTTNIYFGLYNKFGSQIDKKLYHAKEGFAEGSFEISAGLASGEYFLKISTNWMKNFKEDDSYVQKVRIINPKIRETDDKKISEKEYDFQFLAEGGHIVANTKNSIGIKAIDDKGKGTSATGIIFNSKNQQISSFKSNKLGLGKFTFTPKKGEKYTAKITLNNGKVFEQQLPEILEKGISIILNNLKLENVVITLNTNDSSLEIIKNRDFKLLLHKDGKVKSIPVVFKENTKQILIARKDLYKGMNTVTLFNDKKQPIVERMFFNNESIQNHSLIIEKIISDEDSISYVIKSNQITSNRTLNASISILPTKTESYNPDHTIATAIYLKPYLKGIVENPQYYFKNFDRKKKHELDVLIITQGWSKYSWDDVFNFPPKPSFDFENGISVNGFVNTRVQKIESIFLHPTMGNKAAFIPIDEKGRFNIKNFYPVANEEIKFSYLNKKGSLKKPAMSISYIKLMDKDFVNTDKYLSFYSFYKDKSNALTKFLIDDNVEQLDEIKLKTDYRRKLWKETHDPILVNGKITRITEEEVNRYPNIYDLLSDKGFDVTVWQGPNYRHKDGTRVLIGDVIITSRRPNRQAVPNSPLIFLDGVRLSDANALLNMNTDKIEKVVIDKTGVGLGLGAGLGGVIKITTRKTNFKWKTDPYNNTSFINISTYGFQPKKEFYAPKYTSYQMKAFNDFGIIHWTPNLNISNENASIIKTVNTGLHEINFYIEGVYSDGTVFSQKVTIDNSKS
tara:strand:- start:23375 stop:25792 length:2418 start_codon:yes stop_codon:yes gene_type:complete